MSFYQSISGYYREIFPLQPVQAWFVRESFPDSTGLSLLDVGCGTGDLSIELSGSFNSITGIDLDATMVDIARKSATANVRFLTLDMLEIQKRFGQGAFEGILCFGNTLVHLQDQANILGFVQQAGNVLGRSGKLLIQIINYDRILDQDVRNLPEIDTEHFSFVRNYEYDKNRHLVIFESILKIKARGESIRNRIPLYPLRKAELHSMLTKAGFRDISYYGNFKKEALNKESIQLVVEAST